MELSSKSAWRLFRWMLGSSFEVNIMNKIIQIHLQFKNWIYQEYLIGNRNDLLYFCKEINIDKITYLWNRNIIKINNQILKYILQVKYYSKILFI